MSTRAALLAAVALLCGCGRARDTADEDRISLRAENALTAACGRILAPGGGVPLLRRLGLPDLPDADRPSAWREALSGVAPGAVPEIPGYVGIRSARETELGRPNQETFVNEGYLLRVDLSSSSGAPARTAVAEVWLGPVPVELPRLPRAGR